MPCVLSARMFLFVLALVALPSSHAFAAPITIDFEDLNDFDALFDQYVGVTFVNGLVLEAEVSVNEDEFPPASGTKVGFEFGGPLEVHFATPVDAVGAYFTYLVPLVLTAFDAAHKPLGTASSAFGMNLGLSGEPGSAPNEWLGIVASGISYIRVVGTAESAYVLDDLTYDRREGETEPAPVPEPATLTLFGLGIIALFAANRRIRRAGS